MEQNNKTLLIAVLIILLALVAFNFNNISGRPVSDVSDASISASPSVVTIDDRTGSGTNVDLVVDTGSVGLDKRVYLHRADGSRMGTVTETLCTASSSECNGVISKRFFIPSSVPSGEYYISGSKDTAIVNSNTFSVRHV
ncbi:MAG: hypothetical protein AABW46_00030 [Nanoarchaeota archaeon]